MGWLLSVRDGCQHDLIGCQGNGDDSQGNFKV